MDNIMNIEDIENRIEKINMYINEEDLSFEELKNNINNIDFEYISHNQNNLKELLNELTNKMNVISRNHKNNVKIINSNINKYITTSNKVKNIFEDIDTKGA